MRFELQPQEFGTLLVLDHRQLGRRRGLGTAPAGTPTSTLSAASIAFSDEAWTAALRGAAAGVPRAGRRARLEPAADVARARGALHAATAPAPRPRRTGSTSTCSTRPRSGVSNGCGSSSTPSPTSSARSPTTASRPLHLACFAGGSDAVRLLVERGAPLERLAEASFARVRPLGTAVFAGNVEAAQILLEAGADPNGVDSGEHRAAADGGGERERGARAAPARARGYPARVNLELLDDTLAAPRPACLPRPPGVGVDGPRRAGIRGDDEPAGGAPGRARRRRAVLDADRRGRGARRRRHGQGALPHRRRAPRRGGADALPGRAPIGVRVVPVGVPAHVHVLRHRRDALRRYCRGAAESKGAGEIALGFDTYGTRNTKFFLPTSD